MADLEALLKPIRDDSPAGEDIRLAVSDLTLQKLKEYRSELDPELDPSGAGRAADWNAAARECETALRSKTKDLDVAVGLAEAWARLRGFAGLRDGLELIAQLCERFWDALHPGCEGEKVELGARLTPLNWLGSSKLFLRSVDSCELITGGGEPRASWELFRFSQLVDEASERTNREQHQELLARGYIDGAGWRARLQAAAPGALRSARDTVAQCESALAELLRAVEKRAGEEADGLHLSPLAERLAQIREHLEQQGGLGGADSSTGVSQGGVVARAAHAGLPPEGIQTREQALRVLADVAAYYQRSEPHSPIALLVLRAVRWGGMSFEQVLPELIADQGALARAWDTLGIRSERSGA